MGKPIEGEIVEANSQRYISNDDIKTPRFPLLKLIVCIVPLIGLLFSVYWLHSSKKNNSFEIVFAIFGLIISLFSTITFLTLRFILKAIF